MTTKQQANITLWMLAIKRQYRNETNVERKAFLATMYQAANDMLPTREAP